MISKYLSDKLKAISFLLMVMVVFLHSYNLTINFKTETENIKQGYNSFVQELISEGLARIAVPLFFIISGYLFFLSFKNGTLLEFFSKYKKRSKTLVLPYILWSVYGILFYLILQLIPFSKPFFTNELIADYSIYQVLQRIFIDPIPYQLWFLRDLIVLILLSPMIYWSIKYFKFYVISILLLTWFFQLNYLIFSNESLLFFALGGYFSINKIDVQKIKVNKLNVSFSIIWVCLIIIKTCFIYKNIDNEWVIRILHKLSILTGIISIWLIYDVLFEKIDVSKTKYYQLFQYTFFLYAFHEPILNILKKALYYILGQTELSSFLIYFSAPTITIILSILIGFLTRKTIPKYYYLMTGGR